MIILILTIPLTTFVMLIIFGRWFGLKGGQVIAQSSSLLLILLAWLFYVLNSNTEYVYEVSSANWIESEEILISWSLLVNHSTMIMMLLIVTVSPLVNIYSINYMQGEPHLNRFISYLNLFTFFMLILVTSSNLLQLFVGWEGVGICSYLLVSFWYTREKAVRSAFKAMAVNKIGDMAFLMAMGLLFFKLKTINIVSISNMTLILKGEEGSINTLICILLIVAVMGKSAQIGLHTWLPAAMEGPTPVSALIHAATMVTAGVFLIVRLSPLFMNSSSALFLLAFLGGITCLVSASIGCMQTDIKKVIAYSTCSQLGYMVLVCGYAGFNISLTHLFNHGMFKALLFLSAGVIIHTLMIHQSFYKMSIKWSASLANISVIIGSLAICGFPFLTGFYSKDILLEFSLSSRGSVFPVVAAYLAAGLTCFYSIRLHFLSFRSESRFSRTQLPKGSIETQTILVLSILAIFSLVAGYFNSQSILNGLHKPIMVSNLLKLMPMVIILLVIILSQSIIVRFVSIVSYFYSLMLKKAWFDILYSRLSINLTKKAMLVYGFIDQKLLEWVLASSVNSKIKSIWISYQSFYSSYIIFKAISIIFWLLLIIILLNHLNM